MDPVRTTIEVDRPKTKADRLRRELPKLIPPTKGLRVQRLQPPPANRPMSRAAGVVVVVAAEVGAANELKAESAAKAESALKAESGARANRDPRQAVEAIVVPVVEVTVTQVVGAIVKPVAEANVTPAVEPTVMPQVEPTVMSQVEPTVASVPRPTQLAMKHVPRETNLMTIRSKTCSATNSATSRQTMELMAT